MICILLLYPLCQLGKIHSKITSALSSPGHPVFIQSDILAPELHYKHWNRRIVHVLPPSPRRASLRFCWGCEDDGCFSGWCSTPPPPYCSFARHLGGKMAIHFSDQHSPVFEDSCAQIHSYLATLLNYQIWGHPYDIFTQS